MTTLRYTNDYGNGHSGFVDYGSGIAVITISGQPLEVTTVSNSPVQIQPAGVAGDAFGRLRTSEPFTLFDSSHRFSVNGNWSTSGAVSGDATHNAAQGLVDLAVTTTSGSLVYRETNKVFPYQPGKSLLVMATFVMAPGQTNLRQRVGYFGTNNGIYLQKLGTTTSIVKRSYVSGSVVNTVIAQSSWNEDKLDGTGKSGITLDTTKAQIFWADFEWLGVGTVRTGFVIDGQFIVCHTFDHANIIDSTYITTATLPLRYEIEALDTLGSAATLKEICATVISEGGYELRGQSRSITTPITGAYTFTTSGVNYPIAAIRLKTSPDRLDSVVIPNALSFMGQGQNGVFNWKVIAGGTVSGGTWTSADSGSSVNYNLSGASISGGTVIAQGFTSSTIQSKTTLEISTDSLFKYQLERNSFTNTPTEFAFVVAGIANGLTGFAALDWQEVTT
jgi:hypothetical protein